MLFCWWPDHFQLAVKHGPRSGDWLCRCTWTGPSDTSQSFETVLECCWKCGSGLQRSKTMAQPNWPSFAALDCHASPATIKPDNCSEPGNPFRFAEDMWVALLEPSCKARESQRIVFPTAVSMNYYPFVSTPEQTVSGPASFYILLHIRQKSIINSCATK